jgi:DNA polymerase-1
MMGKRLAGVQLHLVRNIDDVMEFKRWLGTEHANNVIAVDTETSGLDPYEPGARIRMCQFGDTKTGWAIPWDEWKGAALEALKSYEGGWIFHNIGFDVRWLEEHSTWRMPWHRGHDTMIQAHLMDPTQPVALKNLSTRLIDRNANAGEYLLKESMHRNGWTWDTVPVDFDQYWGYAALDVVLTANLHDHFQIMDRYPTAYELELAVRRITLGMEQNGSRIDVEYCERKYKELNDYVEYAKQWGKDNLGISIGSNVQLVRYFETLGAEITETTASGSKSVNKDQLKILVANGGKPGEIADWVLKVRKADKLAGTYFKNFIEGNVDEFVHPSIRTLGARTGRMSITNPALQTLPKGEATVRRAFIPRADNEVIITSDLDQVEFRMFASMSNDSELIALFRAADEGGADVFTGIGQELYSDPSMTKADKRRGSIKSMIYGRLYGAGVAKQAITAGVPTEVMQAMSDRFDALYPGMKRYQEAVESTVTGRFAEEGEGYVLLESGRRLPVDRERMYTGVNYMIQGGAAEVFKRNLVKLDMAGFGDMMMVPVHDEIVLSVPAADAADCMDAVKECMTTRDGWSIPLTSGIDGPLQSWGEKYE